MRVCDGFEQDVAIGIILGRLKDVAVGILQLESELLILQIPVLQELLDGRGPCLNCSVGCMLAVSSERSLRYEFRGVIG